MLNDKTDPSPTCRANDPVLSIRRNLSHAWLVGCAGWSIAKLENINIPIRRDEYASWKVRRIDAIDDADFPVLRNLDQPTVSAICYIDTSAGVDRKTEQTLIITAKQSRFV